MTFVSYAQNFEDLMLWRALHKVENGFYLDVGAAWPDIDSVTLAFYLKGWRGVNVEPHLHYHQKLTQNRPRDINLRVAVGEVSGPAQMHFFENTGLSTLNPTFAQQHQQAGWKKSTEIIEQTTLAALWEQHVPSEQAVHFLKIDVEGHEGAVIRGNDWSRYRPWIVLVEATLPGTQTESHAAWEPVLMAANYQYAYADGLNRFYVAAEQSHLLPLLKYPPNAFDNYITNQQRQLQIHLQQMQTVNQRIQQDLHATTINLEHERRRAAGAEQELHRALNSLSWKMTAPLRTLQSIIRRPE